MEEVRGSNPLRSTVTKQKLLDNISSWWHSTIMENESSSSSGSKKGMSPMIIVGVIVLIVIIAGVGYAMMKGASKSAQTPTSPEAQPTNAVVNEEAKESPAEAMKEASTKTFEVDGSNFKFEPNTLTVNDGDTVKITFKNTQGFHNFMIDEFNAKSKTIQANQTDELTFVANKKGTFQYYCGVGNHRAMGMVGTLTVK